MYFHGTTLEARATKKSVPVWYPDPKPLSHNFIDDSRIAYAELNGQRRAMVSRLISLAGIFNEDYRYRNSMGHNGGVFAYACQEDDAFTERPFYRDGRPEIRIRANKEFYEPQDGAPKIYIGQIAAIGTMDPIEGRFRATQVTVRASADAEEPLFLTKLSMENPVVLSTLPALQDYYSAPEIRAVDDLCVVI